MAITSVIGAAIMSTKVNPDVLQNSPLWGKLISENGGLLATSHLFYSWSRLLVMLLIGIFIGFLNGLAVARFNMPPFMVTLVSMSSSAPWRFTSLNRKYPQYPGSFIKLGKGDIISLYVGEKVEDTRRDILSLDHLPHGDLIGLGFVAHFLLSRTIFGRHVYAIGTNRRAAHVSGVPTQRVIILVYMFSGFCAAVAGILYSARLEAGGPRWATT